MVLNGSLFPGRSGYAGAVGPMPLPIMGRNGETSYEQMLRRVSILSLAEKLTEAGKDPRVIWRDRDDWSQIGAPLEDWLSDVASGLALMTISATSIIDFEAIIIDGGFPPSVRDEIVQRTIGELNRFNRQGLVPVEIVAGSIGPSAPAIGGACLPLLASFRPGPRSAVQGSAASRQRPGLSSARARSVNRTNDPVLPYTGSLANRWALAVS